MQLRAEFFDILNHPNFTAAEAIFSNSSAQLELMGTPGLVTPLNASYAQRSNPAAYALPTATTAGGVLCNPSGVINAAPVGPCYLPSTALSTTVPGSNGGQRQIEFAVRFMF
jgi:hypothetical protein